MPLATLRVRWHLNLTLFYLARYSLGFQAILVCKSFLTRKEGKRTKTIFPFLFMWQTGIFSTSPTLVVNCPTRGIICAHCDKKFHFCSKIQFWQSKQIIFTWKIQKKLAPSLFWYFWGLPEMLISLADVDTFIKQNLFLWSHFYGFSNNKQ